MDRAERLDRAAANLADLVALAEQAMADFMATNADLRNRVLADVAELAKSPEATSVEALLGELGPRVEGYLGAHPVAASAVGVQVGDWTVGVEGGCLGDDGGGGVTATRGNTTVKACMTGSISSGPTGGGIEVKSTY